MCSKSVVLLILTFLSQKEFEIASKSGKSKSLSGDRNNLLLRDTPIALDHIHMLLHVLYGNGLHT